MSKYLNNSSRNIFKKSSKRRTYLGFLIYLVLLNCCLGQKSMSHSLDGKWSFKIDPYSEGEKMGWSNEVLNTSTWDSMNVPGNWDLANEYADYAGDAWYSRTFTIDKSTSPQQIRIVFQSIYHDSKVWINGQKVGENHLGFLPFYFDISKHIKYGKKNRVTVLANNVFKRGAIWNWGGIRRPVHIEATPLSRIEYQHIDAVPDLVNGSAEIKIKTVCSNSSNLPQRATLNISIKNTNNIIVEHKIQVNIPANTKDHITSWSYKMPKALVELWHFDFPHLYTSTITLTNATNKVIHSRNDRFGIRILEIKGLELHLNGESIRPVGFNIVPDDRFTGNTLPFERIKEDVDLMKCLGVNMARLSHLSLPKEYLDYLDEKGIMVIEEVGLWGKDTWVDPEHPMPKEWLQRIILEKYNHPSVIGWSVGNEIGDELKNPKVNAYVKGAIQMSKDLDPNRLAVYASNTAQKYPNDATQYADLALINVYGGWGQAADRTWALHKKPIFVSEFGNNLSDEDPNIGNIPIQKMMNTMRNKEYVLGTSLWTFNDYRSTHHGVTGWKTPPSQNRAWGIVTTFRDKKRAFYDLYRENAPIKNITISSVDLLKREAKLIIQPRTKLDIPANTLRGYSLRYNILDPKFNKINRGLEKIKTINPGDSEIPIDLKWENTNSVNGLQIEFLDPQGYVVWEETQYYKIPVQPKIKFANTYHNGVRIIFDKSNGASEYFIKYQLNDSVFYTEKTINNFITIEDERLKQGVSWQYQLIAVNNAGESMPSTPINLTTDEDEAPPIIWNVKRTDNGIFIGYSVAPDDYLYEVEYGNSTGAYTKKLGTKVKGVLNIPRISKGEVIYLRMRVRKQWGFAGEWSHEVTI